MGAALGRIVSDYRGLVEVCQQRAVELDVSRLEIDRLAGWIEGYSSKLLGNGNSKREKRLWPIGFELMLSVLGLKILIIEDESSTKRTLSLRTPVKASHQRFGNTSNVAKLISAPSNEDETINTTVDQSAHAPVSPVPVASRAHLRVIQTKSGRKFG